jgi:hypothetical protein
MHKNEKENINASGGNIKTAIFPLKPNTTRYSGENLDEKDQEAIYVDNIY